MEGKMNCEESRNLMTISVYGKLTSSERSRLEAHLQECASCAGQSEKVRKLSHLFTEKEDVPLPDMEKSWRIISAGVFKRRPRWLAPHGSRRPVFRFSYALSLLILGFAAGYLVHSGWPRDGQMAQLRREVLQIREIAAASLLRQESLNTRLRGLPAESLAELSKEDPLDSFLKAVISDPVRRQEFIESLSEQTSPMVEIALALARNIERI
jgi:anti-sigma factor RsiW